MAQAAVASSDSKSQVARLELPGKTVELPIVIGSADEPSIDIGKLRDESGYITLDDGFRNTGSCESAITFIDGDKGILRYRGIPIEQIAEHSTFVETAYLIIYGELPTKDQLAQFSGLLTDNQMLHEGLRNMFDGFPSSGHPMAVLSAMINAVSCYHPDIYAENGELPFDSAAARLISKVRTVAAAAYKTSIGHPIMYPDPAYDYCTNFLHMMFSIPRKRYEVDPDIRRALDLILLLHADHEQNCSTSTVRMVGSSGANLFASCSAGVCALWGPLHGGANVAVLQQLNEIHRSGVEVKDYIENLKKQKLKLFGFGHGVYRNFDPRAKILSAAAEKVLAKLHKKDPLLDIARRLEETALSDSYFVDRKLYPNVDFYSGIIMRAIGIPTNMFTVMFAIGRMPGWIANWKEVRDTKSKIYRPRQVYQGQKTRDYVPMAKRS